jgi:hypothetical protein
VTRFIGDRDDLAGLLRDLNIRLERQERHVHNNIGPRAGGGADEVWIGFERPTDPALELWFDTGTHTLNAKVAGNWERITTGAGTEGPPGPGWPIVVKATPPDAADYDEATIPFHAVWVQIP